MNISKGLLAIMLSACGPQSLTILSFNTASGAGAAYNDPSHQDLQLQWLQSQTADILALQEVRFYPGSRFQDLETRGGRFYPAVALETREWGYGLGLWLSPALMASSPRVWTQLLPHDGSEEQRVAQVLEVYGYRLVFTHLSVYGPHPTALRALQWEAIRALQPQVVAGDLNCHHEEAREALESLGLKSVNNDDIPDQIWSPGGKSVHVSTEGLSDHSWAPREEIFFTGDYNGHL